MAIKEERPLIREAKSEAEQLDVELEQTSPLYRRLKMLRILIDEFSDPDASEPPPARRKPGGVLGYRRDDPPMSARVRDAAEEYLGRIGRRAKAPEIAAALMNEGLSLRPEVARGLVGSYLSGCGHRFDNKKGEGFGLARWMGEPPMQNDIKRQ